MDITSFAVGLIAGILLTAVATILAALLDDWREMRRVAVRPRQRATSWERRPPQLPPAQMPAIPLKPEVQRILDKNASGREDRKNRVLPAAHRPSFLQTGEVPVMPRLPERSQFHGANPTVPRIPKTQQDTDPRFGPVRPEMLNRPVQREGQA